LCHNSQKSFNGEQPTKKNGSNRKNQKQRKREEKLCSEEGTDPPTVEDKIIKKELELTI
jgi:hypothetical protein